MSKILAPCLLLLLTTQTLQAQPLWRMPWAKSAPKTTLAGKEALSNINISTQLDRRMATTFMQAKQAQAQTTASYQLVIGHPIQQIFRTEELNPQEIYPNQPFLKNSTQAGKYLVARNNRLFMQELRRMKTVRAQINQYMPQLQQEAAQLHQPDDVVPWLAETIPATTQQLFIGEIHTYSEIHNTVSLLLQQLRKKYPRREMILFTEFLPKDLIWKPEENKNIIPDYLHLFIPLWDQIVRAHIPVIGLESPAAIADHCTVRYENKNGNLRKESVWTSLEGIRLRNEQWAQTIASYRALYPNALFIIYTGASHSLYNHPFSLASLYPKDKTFMLALYPDKQKVSSSSSFWAIPAIVEKPYSGPLEYVSGQAIFPQPVLKWNSAQFAHITGFNVRIKVPVKLDSNKIW